MANTSVRVDTVGLGIAFSLGETYRIAIDEGFVNQEGNSKMPIAANTNITSFSTPANPPQIANTIPTHTSTAPINISNVSFTIDRSAGNLTILGGNVFLNRQGSPNIVVKTFAVSNASVSGNTVAFSVIGNLEASQTYFITSNANIFLDRDGFKNNAISNSSSYRFVSPVAPIPNTFSPSAPANPNFTEIFAGFDRTIFSNSGNLFLHNANTNAVIRTYNISSALISNNQIVLDIVGNIDANGYYYVKSNANVIMDVTQIKYPGFTNTTLWAFQAPVSPYINSTVPTRATTSASRSLTTVSFTLDRTVTAISGNVYLYKQASPNVLLKTWTIGSNVSFNNNSTFTVTVPQGMLAPTQAHYISTDANIAKDLTYINFPGISTTGNTFTFTTDVAPLLSNTTPSYGTALDENASNISFTMDRLVSKNIGNVYLYKIDTVNGNSLVKTYDINANTYLLSNQIVNLPITSLVKVMESYYVNTDFDVLQDFSTNEKFQGIIDANTFVFTTAVDRSYVIDRTALLFPNNIPQITETDTGATYIVSLQLSTAIGQIQANGDNFASPTGWTAGTRTYSVTGTKTTVNSALSNLYFFPFVGTSSSATLTYSVTKNSVFQKSLVFAITSSANPGYLDGGGSTYTIAEDSKFNFMPFYVYPSWNSNCVVMLKSVQSGNVAVDAGKFYANTATGWTNANDGVIYKAFSRPANIAVYNSQVAEVRDIYYWLASDYTTSFSIDALLGIESTPSGNTLTGGTVYSVTNNYNITPSGEFSLLTSGTYDEDLYKAITLTFSDADTHPSITYNVQIQQISPDPGLVTGSWTSPGFNTRFYGGLLNDTSDKSTWGAVNSIAYYPPQDYTGTILLGTTITKIQPGKANVTLDSNVATTLTNSVSHNEYEFQENKYYNDLLNGFGLQITDLGSSSYDNYYLSIKQISPDPAVYPANIVIQSIDYGTIANVSGTKADINGWLDQWYSYPDYVGNIVFGYTQIKNSYNGNITQASNVAVTYSNYAFANNYNLSSSVDYLEDTNASIPLTISDEDVRFTNYYINVRQISPDPTANVANIIIGSSYGTNVSLYANRATINSLTKTITPPADWTSNIVLGYTQIKSTSFGNITQADNVAITYTNLSSSSEVFFPIYGNVSYSNIPILLSGLVLSQPSLQIGLLGGETVGTTAIKDSSNNSYTITNNGSVTYSSTTSKWSSTSLYFNGSNYLRTPNSSVNVNSNFTWEAWVYKTTSDVNYLVSGALLVDTRMFCELPGGAIAPLYPMPLNTWSHIAVTRSGNTIRIFLDGTQRGTFTYTPTAFITYLDIGQYSNNYFVGYMEDVAFFNTARYTSNFTPSRVAASGGNITITDVAANKSYSVTLTAKDNLGNINISNPYTVTGNLTTINSALGANLTLTPGYYNTTQTLNLNYLQVQTTDNIIQANVDLPFTVYPIPNVATNVTASVYSNTIYNNVAATISYTGPSNGGAVSYYEATIIGTNLKGTAVSGNIVFSNLTAGNPVQFVVKAVGVYGNSANATSNSLTIYSPPTAPTIANIIATSNTSIRLFSVAPSIPFSDGGFGIQSYTATANPGNIAVTVNRSGSGYININGLTPSTDYTISLYASQIYGNSPPITSNVTTRANALPAAPNSISTSITSNTAITVSWTAPTVTGNVSLTQYVITSNVGNVLTTTPPTTSAAFTGLAQGQTYTFDVYAVNSYGNGAIISSTPTTTFTNPSAPSNLAAFSTNTTNDAYLTWSAPSYTGGGITGYTITANTGNTITVGNVTSTTFGNLSNTQPYTFTVYASNPYGNSSNSSSSNSVFVQSNTNSSGYFGGGSATLLTNILPLSSGDWTIDLWVYNTNTSPAFDGSFQQRCLFDTRTNGGSSNDGMALRQSSSSSNAYTFIVSGSVNGFTATGRINNQWQHLALVKANNITTLYIDGQNSGSYTYGGNVEFGGKFRLSGFNDDVSATTTFTGYMDNVIVSNVARYAGNFTPSTSFAIDQNTTFLTLFNGTDNSSSILNDSFYSNTISNPSNLVRISTAQYK